MQLYYFKDPHGNFGDDLNPWLWQQLLPEVMQGASDEIFVGIGTLLNHRLPPSPRKHVFGSGYGYGRKPLIDERWSFDAVRGHETARALGLPRDLVITDAAVLIRALRGPRSGQPTARFGFMPHCQSSRLYDWSLLSAELGFRHIDVRWDVERVMAEMSQCDTLICEAMHGAIVADALRIPWIPVTCYEDISAFKWQDWLSTLELPYTPVRITSLFDAERGMGAGSRFKNSVKRTLRRGNVWSVNWTEPPPARTGDVQRQCALRELEKASKGRVFLSHESFVQQHVERYLDKLGKLRSRLQQA